MFALVLLSIIKNSLDYIYSRNEQGENDFHTEKWKKKMQFLWHCFVYYKCFEHQPFNKVVYII